MWILQERNTDHPRRVRVVTVDVNYVMFRNEKNQVEYLSWFQIEKLIQES